MTSFTSRPSDQWKTPSPRLIKMRSAEVSFISLVAAVATSVVLLLLSWRWALGGFVLFILAGALWLVLERRRVRSWAYCEREEELLVQRGLMFKRLSVVPYGRMQFIDVTAGPAERIFKLATVQLHTAAATTDARIPGLIPEEANRLRDQLSQRGEARLSGL